MATDKIYFPEDKIPLARLVPMGLQHVVAMFGATVLAPVLMGFNPQTALFFSGIGTMIFLVITGFKVPSYLGSSFAFIGPVLAVTGGSPDKIPFALCGIAAAALCYAAAAWVTLRRGPAWIDALMPPVVTGSVVALIGLNLSSSALSNALNPAFTVQTPHDWAMLSAAAVTFSVSVAVSIYAKGFMRLLPILSGVVAGYAYCAFTGMIPSEALEAIGRADWLGLPSMQTPQWSLSSVMVIAPVFVVLVAENKGHLAAISSCMGRDLNHLLGRTYLGDAAATFFAAMGGGTPQTTYAENMGVMAITRVFSVSNFAAAAVAAMVLGLCPKFGAAIQSIPGPVLGGVSLILYGLITLMGVKIWVDAKVDFCDHRNLIVAGASVIAATGLGMHGLTVGGINIAGIAFGTVLALVLNLLLRPAASKHREKCCA
ncbi:MAG: pyrimidine utilization transport protein G [Elusimicrobia bacterium]|nr:pyrimidine utilization transport protein G [Elusimicrobiota bacterium]